jgi:DNA-binding XRE family transcriptional regulator
MSIPKMNKVQKLVDSLVKLSDDEGSKLRAMQILERMRLPMIKVLDKVPGETIVDKAKTIGISRQAFYSWRRGATRPNVTQSKKLAELTGLNWQDINGRTRLSASRPPASSSRSSGSV